MCEELLANENVGDSLSFPRWMDGDAKEAWIENAADDVDVSGTHFLVWESLKDVLPGEEVVLECLTADECFSLDVYVPRLDLGVEVDGPTHYAETDLFTDPLEDADRVNPSRRTSSTFAHSPTSSSIPPAFCAPPPTRRPNKSIPGSHTAAPPDRGP